MLSLCFKIISQESLAYGWVVSRLEFDMQKHIFSIQRHFQQSVCLNSPCFKLGQKFYF